MKIGDSRGLKVGEWVLAIGAPFGFENSATAGIVSAKGRTLDSGRGAVHPDRRTADQPGNSGGPLFNMRGEVVGINSQIYSRSGGYMGVSFSIPIDVAMGVSQQLRGHRPRDSRQGGRHDPAGHPGTLADSLRAAAAGRGAGVERREGRSPAEKAGIEAGMSSSSLGSASC